MLLWNILYVVLGTVTCLCHMNSQVGSVSPTCLKRPVGAMDYGRCSCCGTFSWSCLLKTTTKKIELVKLEKKTVYQQN